MAASHTFAPDPRFPVGTVLSVYPGENRRMPPGPPPVTTGTVDANRIVTFSGLDYDTRYTAGATINGRWLTTLFSTAANPDLGVPQIGDVVLRATAPINLRERGARGAGAVSSSLDTSILLDVIAEATETGQPIKIPYGEDPTAAYIFEAPLLIPDGSQLAAPGLFIEGDGEDVTKLRFMYDGETDGVIRALNPAQFTDRATFRNLAIQGDPNNASRMPYGLWLRSCRRWKFESVEFQYFGENQLLLYGQRYLDGTIDTVTTAKSTLSGLIGPTATSVTLVDGSQYQTTGYLFLDAELIRYSGKSANTLTGLTRGVNGTVAATHNAGTQAFSCPGDTTYNVFDSECSFFGGTDAVKLTGTAGTVRIDGGTANMNTFFTGRFSSATRRGLWIDQGAANSVHRTSAVANGEDGIRVGWYGNSIAGPVVIENNGGYGLNFTGDAEAHDNFYVVHDGGSNVSGVVNDTNGENVGFASRRGLRMMRNAAGTGAIGPDTLYNSPDGILRWKDKNSVVTALTAASAAIGLTVPTVAQLAAGTPDGGQMLVQGYAAVGDGGWGVWSDSATKGVRGKPTVTNQGSGMPNGEYRVLLTGGGGTGASARVVISSGKLSVYAPPWRTGTADDIPDAIILEPGSGYTSVPSLSTNPADWFLFHSNGTAATFSGSQTMPVATFALADNRLSVRTANGREYLLGHDGRFKARQLGLKCNILSTTDAQNLQEAIRSVLTGRSQIASEYGGGPSAGGTIEFPASPIPLEGNTVYVNSMGTPTGTEVVGLRFEAASRGSARTTRPDGAHSGTVFQYGKIVVGDPNSTGVFDTVSRGVGMTRFQVIGGMEFYGVQHAFEFTDVLINPDYPMGEVKNGIRTNGQGLYMKDCSTGGMDRVFVSAGDQVYFGNLNELDGIVLDNCDQVTGRAMAASFCRRGFKAINGCTGLKFHLTAESNMLEDVVVEDVNDCRLELTTLGSNAQDSTLPRVRIGKTGDATTKCWDVRVMDGSFSANPKMIEHALVATSGTANVLVSQDYTHRYPNGAQVIVKNTVDGHVIRTVASTSFDAATNRTTVNVGSGVTANAQALVLVGSLPVVTLAGTSGTNKLLVAGDVTADHAVGDWIIVKNATNGDFAATITAIAFTTQTEITVAPANVNANCTGFQPTTPGDGVAIDAQYATGLDVIGNSILNYQNAVKLGANVAEAFYRRGRWSGADTDEIVKDPAATWAPLYGDIHVAGVGSSKVRALSGTTVAPSILTIASGAITVTDSLHRIDTEALAATDDLTTISWAEGTPKYGQELRLVTNADARDVQITSAGNIVGSGLPVTLLSRQGFVHLVYNGVLAKWVIQSFWSG